MIKIHQYLLGKMDNFIYILVDESTNQAALIDPGWESEFLLMEIKKLKIKLSMILLTHGHFDHIQHTPHILEEIPVPVYISEKEAPSLSPDYVTHKTKDNDTIAIGDASIFCIHTPGHTPGGQCFHIEDHLITGDTLFIDGCGRCSYDNSNVHHMYESLQKIKALPLETKLYPGHHYGKTKTDTLTNQLQTNRFLKATSKEVFVRLRMGT